jgi:hypothetical membrane protein
MTTRRVLLGCGILSSVVYAAANVLVAARADGYSVVSQTVSELSAVDAPTRPLWLRLMIIYGVLHIAFGYGVWRSGGDRRPLRIAGALLVIHGIFGFFWPPMHLRPVLAAGGGTLTDSLHIAWTFVTVALMLLTMGFASAAFRQRFRWYSAATAMLLVAFGIVTGRSAPAMKANLPTPGVGVWERIDIGLFMLWIFVLSTALLRNERAHSSLTSAGANLPSPQGGAL